MWLFMYACYGLTLTSFTLLAATGLQGYAGFALGGLNHPRLAILTAILYLFTQTLVIFFYIGTGSTVKEYVKQNSEFGESYKKAQAIKGKVFLHIMLNILLVLGVFIAGGAVDTGHMPRWMHGLLFLASLIHFGWTIRIEHHSFRETAAIILEMYGLKPNSLGRAEPPF
jgi:hypothetical protein